MPILVSKMCQIWHVNIPVENCPLFGTAFPRGHDTRRSGLWLNFDTPSQCTGTAVEWRIAMWLIRCVVTTDVPISISTLTSLKPWCHLRVITWQLFRGGCIPWACMIALGHYYTHTHMLYTQGEWLPHLFHTLSCKLYTVAVSSYSKSLYFTLCISTTVSSRSVTGSEREWERERESVCVWERERVCVCVRERESVCERESAVNTETALH